MAFTPSTFEVEASETKVAPSVQASRDADAVTILKSELAKELGKTPKDAADKARTDANIAALKRELAAKGQKEFAAPKVKSAPTQPAAFVPKTFEPASFTAEPTLTPEPTNVPEMRQSPPPEPGMADKALAALQGAAKGATAGLIVYPQAVALAATRAATGAESPTWQEGLKTALADVRAGQQELSDQMPVSYGAGQVAGAVGLGALTGGTSLPVMVGTGAVTGAVSGYTQNDSLKDAAVGGTLGALGGAVGKGVTAGYDQVVKSVAAKHIADIIARAQEGGTGAAGRIVQQTNKLAKLQELSGKELQNFIEKNMDKASANMVKSAANRAWESLKGAAYGAGIGGGAALATGSDVKQGAMGGAAVGGLSAAKAAMASAKGGVMLNLANKLNLGSILPGATSTAANAAANIAPNVVNAATTPQEPPPIGSRLRAIVDRLRQ